MLGGFYLGSLAPGQDQFPTGMEFLVTGDGQVVLGNVAITQTVEELIGDASLAAATEVIGYLLSSLAGDSETVISALGLVAEALIDGDGQIIITIYDGPSLRAEGETVGSFNPRREDSAVSIDAGDATVVENYNPRRDDTGTYDSSDAGETGSWTSG